MKKHHRLDDEAKQALEFLLSGTCTSVNAAAIKALGGKDNTNDAQIKSLKRRFSQLQYNRLLATTKDSGTITIKQAKILDLKAKARAALEEAEELYSELGLLEGNGDCFGTIALIKDLTGIVDQYTDLELDTVEMMAQGFASAISGLTNKSWRTGDSTRDEFGNELYSPTLTIMVECDPSKHQRLEESMSRGHGVSSNGQGVTILISDTAPIDEAGKQRNIDASIKAIGNHRKMART